MSWSLRVARSAPPLLLLLLFLLASWGGWILYRTSFVADGHRWFVLFDDAMISMTYARNLVEGHGLEWARWGPPVEGFTHPLWTFLMIPVNALPVALWNRSLIVQIGSLLTLLGTVVAARRLMLDHFAPEGARHWMPAAVLTAFYYPLAYWALMGMETGLQALLTVMAVHLALSIAHQGRERSLALWLVCAAAYLLRMDMLLLVVAVQLYVLFRGGWRAAVRRPGWLTGLALFCAAAGGYELFRWAYFHDLLPNTFYLKLAGVPLSVRLLRGLLVLTAFVRDHLLLLLAAGLGLGVYLRRNARLLLPALVFALYCAYNVYIGGDSWDGDLPLRANRFLAFVMPLLFVLLNALLNEALAAWRERRLRTAADDPAGRFALVGATVAALLLANGLWLSAQADLNWRLVAGTERPPDVERCSKVVARLVAFQRLVRPGAVVATAWAGVPAYFSDYRMIDILGYNDRVVAHMDPVVELDEDSFSLFKPGHVKWDEPRLLDEQRPDAFFQIWGVRRGMGRAVEVMPAHGYRKMGEFWVRGDSPYIQAPARSAEPRLAKAADVLDLRRLKKQRRRAAEGNPPP